MDIELCSVWTCHMHAIDFKEEPTGIAPGAPPADYFEVQVVAVDWAQAGRIADQHMGDGWQIHKIELNEGQILKRAQN